MMEVRLLEISSTEVRPGEVCSVEVRSGKDGSAEICPAEVCFDKFCLFKVRVAEIRCNVGIFFPPLVPVFHAASKMGEVFAVGHKSLTSAHFSRA